ncbi:hypothetical protein CYMTET_31219 [Cymbomonas tetramitiformis]|uniref:Uncharacterized protein n=1 Tax=Cymbomonas tetramitiformis TaxID=36881 RepID=A0AAE0KT34_9CHLO|nr:hypothetical protein CYMTET_31219 [Cymbomonas tetramitiformis]
MACGGGWEVEAEEKRWEAHTGGDGFEETVWYSEEKPHRTLVHTPLMTAMVLDNLKGAAVKHLGEEVKGGLPDGWVSLKVLEAHWTVLDPDLLPQATAAMQALATETAAKLGVQVSVSDPGVVDNLHNGMVAVGDICVPQQFCLHRFGVDETTDQRDVDLPFYFSGAPAEWVKKAAKNRDKMIGKKGHAEETAEAPADDAPADDAPADDAPNPKGKRAAEKPAAEEPSAKRAQRQRTRK